MEINEIVTEIERILIKAKQIREYGSIRDSSKQEILVDLFSTFLEEITPSLLRSLLDDKIKDARDRIIIAETLNILENRKVEAVSELSKLNKEYEKIPISCQICEFFLEDDDFIEEFKTKFVCSFDDEINPEFSRINCGEFKIGKWVLVEFLKRNLGENLSEL